MVVRNRFLSFKNVGKMIVYFFINTNGGNSKLVLNNSVKSETDLRVQI